jgi:hypothetical protein
VEAFTLLSLERAATPPMALAVHRRGSRRTASATRRIRRFA